MAMRAHMGFEEFCALHPRVVATYLQVFEDEAEREREASRRQ